MKFSFRLVSFFLCICLMSAMFAGCKADTPTKPKPIQNLGTFNIDEDALPYSQEEIFAQLFDPENKIEILLDMPEEEVQKLQQDYGHYTAFGSKSPIYRMADVTVTITTRETRAAYLLPQVGVRMKGNTSRTAFYDPEKGIYRYIHFKLDFQETFDHKDYYGSDSIKWTSEERRQTRKDRTFATLEKLDLRWNKCYDSTYLKEAYAYALYRSEGVLAPHVNLSSLDWSGIHMGIYTINEPVDKIFLEKYLPKEDQSGDLYKCGWPSSFTSLDSIGIEDEDKGEFYAYDLKTNKKTSSHQALKELITGLNRPTLTKEQFAQLVDVENFLRYAAVSYFLGNPDDLRNNYNNFYLYFLQSTGKAVIIPYDYDRCLGVTVDWNPSGHGMTEENPFSDRREGNDGGSLPQENPLFIYSVDRGGYYVKEFAGVLEEVARNELLQPAVFKTWFDRAQKLYGQDVSPSKTLENAWGRDFSFDLYRTSAFHTRDNISFDQYIEAKMGFFRQHMENLNTYLQEELQKPARYFIRCTQNNWEQQPDWAMTAGDTGFTYPVSSDGSLALKVYDTYTGRWLGIESYEEATSVPCQTDAHGNLCLAKGDYLVLFDPVTGKITVTRS